MIVNGKGFIGSEPLNPEPVNPACPVKFIEDNELAQLNHGVPFNRGEANLTGEPMNPER